MIVKCIKIHSSDAIQIGKEYIVMGIYLKFINNDNNEVDYILFDYGIMITGFDASYFCVIDNRLPQNWVFNYIEGNSFVIGFPEFGTQNYFDNLYEGYNTELNLFKTRYEDQVKWYLDQDIDDFFVDYATYGITEQERDVMVDYYKSQPDATQWEADKLILVQNRVDFV